nr:MAG TPA: hypothetical protein [Caudoviricetes sp.]
MPDHSGKICLSRKLIISFPECLDKRCIFYTPN